GANRGECPPWVALLYLCKAFCHCSGALLRIKPVGLFEICFSLLILPELDIKHAARDIKTGGFGTLLNAYVEHIYSNIERTMRKGKRREIEVVFHLCRILNDCLTQQFNGIWSIARVLVRGGRQVEHVGIGSGFLQQRLQGGYC